jgi:hypothetical protein
MSPDKLIDVDHTKHLPKWCPLLALDQPQDGNFDNLLKEIEGHSNFRRDSPWFKVYLANNLLALDPPQPVQPNGLREKIAEPIAIGFYNKEVSESGTNINWDGYKDLYMETAYPIADHIYSLLPLQSEREVQPDVWEKLALKIPRKCEDIPYQSCKYYKYSVCVMDSKKPCSFQNIVIESLLPLQSEREAERRDLNSGGYHETGEGITKADG